MEHSEFKIGTVFWCGGRQWRCTDTGTRTIVAIQIDQVEIESSASRSRRVLTYAEAEADGWLNGPPYAVAESVFDEDSLQGCSLERDGKA